MPNSVTPIVYWEKNVAFDSKRRAFAIYELPMSNYEYMSQDQAAREFNKIRYLLYSVMGKGQILSLCRSYDISRFADSMKKIKYDNEAFKEDYEFYVNAVKDSLSHNPWSRHLYFVKELQSASPKINIKLKAGLSREFFNDIKSGIIDPLVSQDVYFSPEYLDGIFTAEEKLRSDVSTIIGGTPVTGEDIEWVIKHNLYRGFSEPEIYTGWQPGSTMVEVAGDVKQIRPNVTDVVSLNDGVLLNVQATSLSMEYDHLPSYVKFDKPLMAKQAILPMVSTPNQLYFPGNEFFYWVDDFPFPIDVAVVFDIIPPNKATQTLRGKILELHDQIGQYMDDPQGAPIHVQESQMDAKILEANLHEGMPLVRTNIFLAVGVSTDEGDQENRLDVKLNKRISMIQDFFGPKQFRITRPPGDQLRGLMMFIPGNVDLLRDFMLYLEPELLAAGIMQGSKQVGDPEGLYLGYNLSGSSSPVLFDPTLPPRINKSAATALIGTLGGGKSVTRKYIIDIALMWGAKVISIDPKDEDGAFAKIPSINRIMKRVDVSADSGIAINPYRIAKRDEDTRAIVINFLTMLLNASDDSKEYRRIAINEAVEYVLRVDPEHWNMITTRKALEFISRGADGMLRDKGIQAEANKAVLLMDAHARSRYGKMLFSSKSDLRVGDKERMTVFNFSNLSLPSSRGENNTLTETERVGTSIMYLITEFARQSIINGDKRDFKILSLDEAWKIMYTKEGSRLMEEIIRMGRTYNVMPIIATQNSADLLDERIKNNLGMVYVFRNSDPKEIRMSLEVLGLYDYDESIINKIQTMKSGQCFMRDIQGRIGQIKIDPVPGYLLNIFDTRPASMEVR